MPTDEKALVTGGAGFLGSELVRQLVPLCSEIIVADNLSTGRMENLEGIAGGNVRFEAVDIRDAGRMQHLMRGVSVVFHFAGLGLRHSLHSPEENHEVNSTGTLKLLNSALKCSIRRFVHVSTSEVYGQARGKPVCESHPTFPSTIYGASKLAGESYTRAFFRIYGLPAVIVRPFNAYGPRCHHEGDRGEVIPRFMLRCLAGRPIIIFGDGRQTRDFTFVGDLARGILAAGQKEDAVGRTINLGSGTEISVKELGMKVAVTTGGPDIEVRHVPRRPGDTSGLVADCSLASSLLGYKPEVPLDEGLQRLKQWYLSGARTPEQLLEEDVEINWVVRRDAADG